DISWEPGELKAVSYNAGKPVATQIKRTVGAPVALQLKPILGPNGFLADGTDIALVDVEALDSKGERCPTFQQRVTFALTGSAQWLGGYESGRTNSIHQPELNLECGINRVALRSERVAGEITLSARCEGLPVVR